MNAILKLADATKFLNLFDGSPDAHCTRDADGEYVTVRKALTVEDVERHLRGESPSVLSIPICADGTCWWGCIDADRHDEADVSVDHAVLAKRITELGLPLVVCKSKSPKGAHVFLFLKSAFSASVVQRLLAHYASVLKIDGMIEIFPKQAQLAEGQIGNGVNLPLFGDQRGAFGRDGEVLDAEGFIALALERRVFAQILESRDLVEAPEAETKDAKDRPLPVDVIRKLHAENLESLRTSKKGVRNDTLNTVCFFAARAFAANALEGTEDQIKDTIREAARASGMGDGEITSTGHSGWTSGIGKPLKILEDEFPERTETLEEFNKRFYVVENLGGKCRVCWETIDPTTGCLFLGHQSFADFYHRFMHQVIVVGKEPSSEYRGSGADRHEVEVMTPIYRSKAKFWLDNPNRRQYSEIIYSPGQELAPDVRNLWRGFSVEPVKGDCGLYLAHVRENICKGDPKKYNWLICWMAWKVRNPGMKSYTAPVFKGSEGVGKNMAAEPFAHLFGAHALIVTRKDHLAGHFNAHLRACSIVIANEAFFAGDRQHESSLKGLITDDFFMIEAKGVDPVSARNRLSIIVMSNESWVVPAGPEARRFSVFDCGAEHKEDTAYFNALQHQLDHGGYEALLYHFLNEVDLADFDPRKCLRTEALAEQQSLSLRGVDALWYECLFRGELPGAEEGTFLLAERLLTWGKLQHRKWENISAEQLGLLLGTNPRGVTSGMNFPKGRRVVDDVQRRGWEIPALFKARSLWDENRFKVAWPDMPAQGHLDADNESGRENWAIVPVGDERLSKYDNPLSEMLREGRG